MGYSTDYKLRVDMTLGVVKALLKNSADDFNISPKEYILEQLTQLDDYWEMAESFLTKKEALAHSEIIERIQIYVDEYNKQLQAWAVWNNNVNDTWFKELKDEYDSYVPGVFNKIYERAYDEGHSEGYDQIAWHVEDLCYFVDEILKIHDNDKIPE